MVYPGPDREEKALEAPLAPQKSLLGMGGLLLLPLWFLLVQPWLESRGFWAVLRPALYFS